MSQLTSVAASWPLPSRGFLWIEQRHSQCFMQQAGARPSVQHARTQPHCVPHTQIGHSPGSPLLPSARAPPPPQVFGSARAINVTIASSHKADCSRSSVQCPSVRLGSTKRGALTCMGHPEPRAAVRRRPSSLSLAVHACLLLVSA